MLRRNSPTFGPSLQRSVTLHPGRFVGVVWYHLKVRTHVGVHGLDQETITDLTN